MSFSQMVEILKKREKRKCGFCKNCEGYLDSEGMICVEEIYNSIEKSAGNGKNFQRKNP